MGLTFNDIVDYCRNMSLSGKEELKYLLEKDITESQRNEIFNNYLQAKKEYETGDYLSSDNVEELKKMIDES
jgi:hypothetical protein